MDKAINDGRRNVSDIDRVIAMLSKAREREELILSLRKEILTNEMRYTELEQNFGISKRQIVTLKDENNIIKEEMNNKIRELMKENDNMRKELDKADHVIKNLLRKIARKPIVHSDGTVVHPKAQQYFHDDDMISP